LSIYEKLRAVQIELHAPKNQNNSFGGYKYRSAEDILEAVKPVLAKHDLALVVGDEMVAVGDRVYVKATASIFADNGDHVFACGFAREPADKKGMDSSQITGAASSYSRKYALNGLFAIDDSKDADSDEYRKVADAGSRAPVSKPAAPKGVSTLDQIKAAMTSRGLSKADVDAHVASKHGYVSVREVGSNELVLQKVLAWVEEQP
jgi:hypothetical protein